jgi:hypothetical protein
MLTVTNAALEQLHDSLAAVSDGDDSEKCFRIMPKDDSNLTLNYSSPATSDTTYKFNDRMVLAIPKELEDFCSGKNLDVNADGRLEIA